MHKLIVTVFLISIVCYTKGQKSRFSVGFDLGTSFPVGAFSKYRSDNSLTGHAKLGWCASASIGFRLVKGMDLVGLVSLQQNGLDNNFYEKYFSNNSLFFPDGSRRYYNNWEVKKNFWSVKSALVGFSKEIAKEATGNRLTAKAKLLSGISFVDQAKFSASSKTDTSYVLIDRSGASSSGLTFLGGLDLLYKISNGFFSKNFLRLFMDF